MTYLCIIMLYINMLDILPIQILQYITNFLDFHSQLNVISTCKLYKSKIKITNLYLTTYHSKLITEKILMRYPYIEKLNLCENKNVNNIDYLQNITHLNISMASIQQENILHLHKLQYLNISFTINIRKLNMFPLLEYIDMMGVCNIRIDELNKLPNLQSINIKYNPIKSYVHLLHNNIKIFQ